MISKTKQAIQKRGQKGGIMYVNPLCSTLLARAPRSGGFRQLPAPGGSNPFDPVAAPAGTRNQSHSPSLLCPFTLEPVSASMGSASWTSTRSLVSLSLLLHLGLCLYADHVDSHPEEFGGLRYTDVDWRVVTDGAALIFHPKREEDLAKGWLAERISIKIGE